MPKKKMTAAVKAAIITAFALIAAAVIGVVIRNANRPAVPGLVPVDQKSLGKATDLPLPFPLDSQFFPSGWMGDGKYGTKYLSLTSVSVDVNGEMRIAWQVQYHRGPEGWAGIYWQHPDGNWGDRPGTTLVGAREIVFLARGAAGGEVVEFKSGGINGAYRDSYERSLGKVALSRNWQQYRISLSGLDLSSSIGAFAWIAPAPEHGDLSFFLTGLEVR